jgi:hypothetical protein
MADPQSEWFTIENLHMFFCVCCGLQPNGGAIGDPAISYGHDY